LSFTYNINFLFLIGKRDGAGLQNGNIVLYKFWKDRKDGSLQTSKIPFDINVSLVPHVKSALDNLAKKLKTISKKK